MTKLSTAYPYTVVVILVLLAGACSTPPTVESDGDKVTKQAPVAPPKDRLHVVKAGDTLSSIARKYTNDALNWKTIAELNNISDPNTITKGLVIVIPHHLTRAAGTSAPTGSLSSEPRSPEKKPPDTQSQTVEVQPQDTEKLGHQTSPLPQPEVKTLPRQERVGGWLIIRGSNYPREINTWPDVASDILTQVWPGTRMQFVDRADGWYKVITEKGHGYLNPDYARVSP